MTTIMTLLFGGWQWIVGIGVAVVAFAGVYFGGKKIGTTQTQAKADVAAAEKDAAQTKAAAEQQVKTTTEAANVQETVNRLPDDDVDRQLREKWRNPNSTRSGGS